MLSCPMTSKTALLTSWPKAAWPQLNPDSQSHESNIHYLALITFLSAYLNVSLPARTEWGWWLCSWAWCGQRSCLDCGKEFHRLEHLYTFPIPKVFCIDGNILTNAPASDSSISWLFSLIRLLLQSFARTIPGVGLYFSTYYSLKQHFFQDRTPMAFEAALLGGGARTVAGILMLPVTVIKTRFEVSTGRRVCVEWVCWPWYPLWSVH